MQRHLASEATKWNRTASERWWREKSRARGKARWRLVSIVTQDGNCLASRVRIATTFTARCIGLLARNRLASDEGLLFVPGGTMHTFGMRFAIDIVFLDQDMRVEAFSRRVAPCRISLAPPRTAFVLELAAGRIDATKLNARERLIMHTNHLQDVLKAGG